MVSSNPVRADAIPSRLQVFHLAWPIMLANCAVPLLGLADTAVIGHTGTPAQLGAIALGSLVFNFIYWGFGFLRMGTTGFVAQASGAGDELEVRTAVLRSLCLGFGIGILLILLQHPLAHLALSLLGGTSEVESLTKDYFSLRIWGAPASLAIFAIIGGFIGLGRSDLLLRTQLFLNGLNIILDILFAGVLGWGVTGIALGTVLAEWISLAWVLTLALRLFRERRTDQDSCFPWQRIFDREKLLRTLSANRDIMIRTLFMLFGFAWFTNESAHYGDILLAANHVLLQLITFSAFVLDGFAHAAEPLVGRAVGRRDRQLFDTAVTRTTELAAVTALLLASIAFLFGLSIVNGLTDLAAVRDQGAIYLPYAAIYILLSFAAFQLDGIFIGATCGRELRNASVLALGIFLIAWWPLAMQFENHGLWAAMIIYVVARAAMLAIYLPGLRRTLQA